MCGRGVFRRGISPRCAPGRKPAHAAGEAGGSAGLCSLLQGWWWLLAAPPARPPSSGRCHLPAPAPCGQRERQRCCRFPRPWASNCFWGAGSCFTRQGRGAPAPGVRKEGDPGAPGLLPAPRAVTPLFLLFPPSLSPLGSPEVFSPLNAAASPSLLSIPTWRQLLGDRLLVL